MDIEAFYDGDPRRRESQELELGSEWCDQKGQRFEVNYVVDTQELYVMAMPYAELIEDPFGDMAVDENEPIEELTVEILAVVPTADALHQALEGWQQEMANPSSLDWLRAHLSAFPAP
jgi:hypothetical protein